jgi:hypothetical protein
MTCMSTDGGVQERQEVIDLVYARINAALNPEPPAAWRVAQKSLSDSRIWQDYAATCMHHMHVHGTYPTSGDAGLWLGRLRSAMNTLPIAQVTWLDARLSGWDQPPRSHTPTHRHSIWEKHAAACMQHMRAHGAYPTTGIAARWLQRLRRKHKQKTLQATEIQWLDSKLPGWNKPLHEAGISEPRVAARWHKHIATCKEYKRMHERYPGRAVSAAGQWLFSIRVMQKNSMLRKEQAEWLDSELPGWSDQIRRGPKKRTTRLKHSIPM